MLGPHIKFFFSPFQPNNIQIHFLSYSLSNVFHPIYFTSKQTYPKLSVGWFKLNADGSTKGNTIRVGRGNLICNEEGNWVKGLSKTIGHALSVMVAAREPQIQNLIVELDAMELVLALNYNELCHNIPIRSIVNDCKSLAQVSIGAK